MHENMRVTAMTATLRWSGPAAVLRPTVVLVKQYMLIADFS